MYHKTVDNGYTEIMKALVMAGTDVNAQNKDSETALMRAENAEKVKWSCGLRNLVNNTKIYLQANSRTRGFFPSVLLSIMRQILVYDIIKIIARLFT